MANRIRKKVKTIKNYDDIIKDITPKNIPMEWTYDMTSTLPRFLSAYLNKYLSDAEQWVELDNDVRDMILDLITELDALENDEWCENSSKTFMKLGKILPYLWW